MDELTKLAKLITDSINTWCDEELIDLFLDDSITWDDGYNTLCSRAEKIAYLKKHNLFDLRSLHRSQKIKYVSPITLALNYNKETGELE